MAEQRLRGSSKRSLTRHKSVLCLDNNKDFIEEMNIPCQEESLELDDIVKGKNRFLKKIFWKPILALLLEKIEINRLILFLKFDLMIYLLFIIN